MTTNLPSEWKSTLSSIAPREAKRIIALVENKQTAALTPDKESSPFILYVLGNSIEDVSVISGIPKDVIYLTYLQYNWELKKDELCKKGNTTIINALQRNLVNHLLAATHKSILAQVGKVMSGEIEAKDCPLIPKSIKSLKELMELVTAMNNMVASNEKPTTVVNAQNVQINQGVEEKKSIPTNPDMINFLENKDGKR